MKNLVYINNGISSVFDSQVLALLKYYQKEHLFDKIILCFGYKTQKEKEWLLSKKIEGIELVFFKTYPNYPFFNFALQQNLLKTLKTISLNFSDFFFHIRGEMPAYHFKKVAGQLNINNNQILTDIRGVSKEEVEIYSASNILLKITKVWNYNLALRALKKDKKIFAVSAALKNYLITKHKLKGANIFINSCVVDNNFNYISEAREQIRKELNLAVEDILIVFSTGGVAGWQSNETILKLANSGFKVLNLSKTLVLHENIITKFISYKEMPDYLSSADIAFIWRDDNIVNQVSSPVKFSEYIACGLPVIHNGTVDLINYVTSTLKCGLLIGYIDELSLAKIKDLISKTNRPKLSETGQSLFGLEQAMKSYYSIYSL